MLIQALISVVLSFFLLEKLFLRKRLGAGHKLFCWSLKMHLMRIIMRKQADQTHSQRRLFFYNIRKQWNKYLAKILSDSCVTNYICDEQPKPALTLCRKMVLQLRLSLEEMLQGCKQALSSLGKEVGIAIAFI